MVISHHHGIPSRPIEPHNARRCGNRLRHAPDPRSRASGPHLHCTKRTPLGGIARGESEIPFWEYLVRILLVYKGKAMSSNVYELLKAMYRAFNAREIDTILAVMHPEIIWPNGWEGGYVYGHQGVCDYWTRQWAAIDPRVDPIDFNTNDAGVIVVRVHQVVRDKEGTTLSDSMVEHLYELENGLIKRMEIKKEF